MVVLESLAQILQECRCIRIFITGRSQICSEVERKHDGAVTFIFIRTTEDGILGFLRKKLMSDTAPNLMSSTLKAEIMKSIPEINSETYVEACRGKSYPNLRADIFESRFLFASLHIKAILRGATVARRRGALKSVQDGAGLEDAYGITRANKSSRRGKYTTCDGNIHMGLPFGAAVTSG